MTENPKDAVGSVRQDALMASLASLIAAKAHARPTGPFKSKQRAIDASRILERSVLRLWAMGYHLKHINDVRPEHVDALKIDWQLCHYRPSAIANYCSAFAHLGDWIGVDLRRRKLPKKQEATPSP